MGNKGILPMKSKEALIIGESHKFGRRAHSIQRQKQPNHGKMA
jgi:hypothetical protein